MQCLVIDFEGGKCFDTNVWKQIISTIPHYCPNIVRLSLSCSSHISEELPLSLFRHYARQLEYAILYSLSFREEYISVIHQFNPDHLRALSLFQLYQQDLEQIANNFPNLTKLEIGEELDQDLNLDCLQKLPHFQELYCRFKLSDDSLRSLLCSVWAQNLRTLVLCSLYHSFHVSKIVSHSILLFRNLHSIRTLSISPLECGQLLLCVEALESLQQLQDFEFSAMVFKPEQIMFEQGLHAMGSRLRRLKRLGLSFILMYESKFSFNYLPTMPLVTDLCINFDEFNRLDEEERNQISCDVQNLYSTFPNLTSLTLQWRKVCIDDMLEYVRNQTRLRFLCINLCYFYDDVPTDYRLQKLCDSKAIDLQFNRE